jgi:hypothetical protein
MFLNRKYRILKKMNFLTDQSDIIDKYINESESWTNHLENTKKAILAGAAKTNKNSCAILGSGWLLDVPLDELSQQYKEVYLFDIVHPSQILHKLKKYSNVVAIELDITGGAIRQVYDSVQLYKNYKEKKAISSYNITGFQYPKEFDYVASVNILSQLDQMLLNYIRKYNIYNEEDLLLFRKILQEKHIQSLPHNKTTLISDFEETIVNENGQLKKKNNILSIDISLYPILAEWEWQFDQSNLYPGENIIFRVRAVEI